ncbi:MAG TPA: hypothetical protein VMW04_00305 [Patescibacteria group bacterium]|nr:hypothetical protein [Patescibacteria group bacterium]
MKQGVNLINREAKKTLSLLKIRKSVKKAVFGTVGFFLVFSILILSTFFLVSQNYKSNQEKIDALKGEIKAMEKNESYATIIANRVKGIRSILQERESYLEVMDEIGALSVPGFELESLEVSNKGDLKISGVCDNRESLVAFDNEVEKIEDRGKYQQIVYPAVARFQAGKYRVSLELKL